MRKRLFLICFSLLLLSGCQGASSSEIYANLQQAAGNVKDAAEEFATSETVQNVREDVAGYMNSWDIQTPDQLMGSINDFFTPDKDKKDQTDKPQDTSSAGSTSSEASKIYFDAAFEATSGTGILTEVRLKKVVDGDTLIVELTGSSGSEESYIRLIGVNTPESVAPDEYLAATGKENSQEGRDASAYVKTLLIDTEYVYLEFDAGEYDKYGRILAYVWLNRDTSDYNNMLNVQLLRDGIAEKMVIRPNTRYEAVFNSIVDDGR